jgi:nucleoid-associated protein YgaU
LPRSPVKVVSVEAEEGGRLYVSGHAAPGSTVRLYLNETLIAPGGASRDGRVSFAVGRGVRAGDYRVRLDDVDPVSGEVKSRAEVTFSMPTSLGGPMPSAAPAAPTPSPRIATQPPTSGAPASAPLQAPPAVMQAPPAAVQPSAPAPQVALAPSLPLATPPSSPAISRPTQADSAAPPPAGSAAPAPPQPPATKLGSSSAETPPVPTGDVARAPGSRPSSDGESRRPPATSAQTSQDASRPPAIAPLADGRPASEPASPEPVRQAAVNPPPPSVGTIPPRGGSESASGPTSALAGPSAARPSTPPPAAKPSREPGGAAAAPAFASVRELDPGTVVIPEVNTAIVSRGDNLWRISRRVYGRGLRYTVIYAANQEQIRNRHLIYPGQVFVLPGETEAAKR